ncbi:hypothetical protein PWT90_03613 [Aphanocladium album]|nr:hypothetical protein PWT90_03613 [Aphanocladium album]
MKLISAALAAYPFLSLAAPGWHIIGAVTGVESFNGIPFAHPPVGDLRLRPPKRLSRDLGVFNATGVAPGCPQMPPNTTIVNLPPLLNQDLTPRLWPDELIKGQEDCLTVTVQRPKGTRADESLPVLFYIFGSGFMFGATNANDAEDFVRFGEKQNQKFIFVGVNYRVGGFGFLGGAEVLQDGSTNLGLRDQRMGLEWVADNIAYFGGDPKRVTLWGQSAGSISVFDQLALNKGNATYRGEPLFHGAIMNSGSIIPTEPVDSKRAQDIFDRVAEATNCTYCLRSVPSRNSTTQRTRPDVLAKTGKYYAVPAILTDQEDEGTLFALAQSDVVSTEKLMDYLHNTFFDRATRDQVAGFVDKYPEDSAAGSPFRTGQRSEWYQDEYGTGKGFKGMAAILGDFVFTLARRLALDGMAHSHPDVPLWSSISSIAHGVAAYYGTAHGTDVKMIFDGVGIPAQSTRTYYLNFLYSGDPNDGNSRYQNWPQWTPNGLDLIWTTLSGNYLIKDDFRNGSYHNNSTNTTNDTNNTNDTTNTTDDSDNSGNSDYGNNDNG